MLTGIQSAFLTPPFLVLFIPSYGCELLVGVISLLQYNLISTFVFCADIVKCISVCDRLNNIIIYIFYAIAFLNLSRRCAIILSFVIIYIIAFTNPLFFCVRRFKALSLSSAFNLMISFKCSCKIDVLGKNCFYLGMFHFYF